MSREQAEVPVRHTATAMRVLRPEQPRRLGTAQRLADHFRQLEVLHFDVGGVKVRPEFGVGTGALVKLGDDLRDCSGAADSVEQRSESASSTAISEFQISSANYVTADFHQLQGRPGEARPLMERSLAWFGRSPRAAPASGDGCWPA